MSKCFCHLNGYEVKDAQARNDIEELKSKTVDVTEFGAVGDGITDDTVAIQNAINSIRESVLTNGIEHIKTLLFPSGKYKITNTIVVSPYVKIKTLGFVSLLSYVSGVCLHLTHQEDDLIDDITGNKQDYYRGPWINGESGLLIKFMGNDKTNSIGIKIGSDTDLGETLPTSRYLLSNIRLQGFNIGIAHNTYNNYMGTFKHISFESNTIGVQHALTNGASVSNSGERMTYIDCIFASGISGIKWNCSGFDSYFTNCSFDFLGELLTEVTGGYHHIVIDGSHIEALGEKGILSTYMNNTKLSVINSNIYCTESPVLFPIESELYAQMTLTLENNKILYKGSMSNFYDNPYLVKSLVYVSARNNTFNHGLKGNFISEVTNLPHVCDFSSVNIGSIASGNYTIGNWSLEYSQSAISSLEVCEDDTFNGRYLKIIPTDKTNSFTVHTISPFIPVIAGKLLRINYSAFNLGNDFPTTLIFYDKDGTKIKESSNYHYVNSSEKVLGSWVLPTNIQEVRVPKNACYVRAKLNCIFKSGSEYGNIGKLFMEYE